MAAKDPVPEDLTLPIQHNSTPLRALRVASRKKLSTFLDLEGNLVVVDLDGFEADVVNDYSGLAELAGFSYQEIMNMKRQKSPTQELLELWTSRQDSTVGKLWKYLYMMERYDVLTECRRPVLHDCNKHDEYQQLQIDAERHNIEQDPTVSTSEMKVDETKFATIHDVQGGQRRYYDAFVCYSAEDLEDRKFLYGLIDELEKKRGLKLFVPGRDDLPGSAEHTITAYLIEKRCRRVIILLSRSFSTSAACEFQVKFAHALAPSARSKKLIPVIREKETPIMNILRPLNACDFSRPDMVMWVWDRLFTAITAPTGPSTYFEEDDSSADFGQSGENLQDIKFPTQRRLDENKEMPGSGSRTSDVHTSVPRQPIEHSVTSISLGQSDSGNQQASTVSTSFHSESSPHSDTGRSFLRRFTGSGKQSKPPPDKSGKR